LKTRDLERALVTGEDADLLQRYFGSDAYAELQELAREPQATVVTCEFCRATYGFDGAALAALAGTVIVSSPRATCHALTEPW